jgi:hypothetical protein
MQYYLLIQIKSKIIFMQHLGKNYKKSLSWKVLSNVHALQEFSAKPSNNNPVAGKEIYM